MPHGGRHQSRGRGVPVVKTANWMNHVEFDWQSPVWSPLLRRLAEQFRLIRYDERGTGLSDWDVADISFETFVRDLETVVDALRLDRFALFGNAQGAAVAIVYAVRHPERVSRLVLSGGYAQGWRARGNPAEIEGRKALLKLIEVGWGQDNPAFRQVFTSLMIPGGTLEQAQWVNDLQRVSTSPKNAARLLQVFGDIDVTQFLPRVTAPTLVLHSRGDSPCPFEQGLMLARGIPNARFVALESRTMSSCRTSRHGGAVQTRYAPFWLRTAPTQARPAKRPINRTGQHGRSPPRVAAPLVVRFAASRAAPAALSQAGDNGSAMRARHRRRP